MDLSEHIKTGRSGEDVAVRFLEEKGYKIIERNRRKKRGEIDVIAEDNGEVVFVEVRAKTGGDFGTPEETVDSRKIQKLIRNAESYVYYQEEERPYRIDVVAVVFGKDKEVKEVRHYESITG
jgi:putative endonuclease